VSEQNVSKKVDVAVVGATGAVGEAMLEILHQRKFPVGKVYAVASARSAGSTVDFGNRSLLVEDLATFGFHRVRVFQKNMRPSPQRRAVS
jgi:aspartate-semialdehyde dehydrogenase